MVNYTIEKTMIAHLNYGKKKKFQHPSRTFPQLIVWMPKTDIIT